MTSGSTIDLGNGFSDHGVATPVSNHRGTVATIDGDGRNVVLVWLFDHRGGYAILMIDVETGDAQQYPAPFTTGDCPFASILSTDNRYYTHFGNWFCEFDPVARAFTFHRETVPQMAMSMTQDDAGRIWSVTYPNSGAAVYDPANGSFRDYGHLYQQDWPQYQRSVAADDTGHIYFAIGNTLTQIIALDPDTGNAVPLIAEADRTQGTATVYRDESGKVYGNTSSTAPAWVELYKGKMTPLDAEPARRDKPFIAGSQGLFHRDFPDGTKLVTCDLIDRQLTVTRPDGTVHEVAFDYTSDGAHLMGVAAAPDGTLCGGTAFPMRFFRYDPKGDTWDNHPCFGQANTVVMQGDRFFVGGYIYGFLLEWDPASPWADTVVDNPQCNPRLHVKTTPDINRPHCLLAHPDGNTIVMGGTPDYGYTGGGLLFFDRYTKTSTLLKHADVMPDHSTMSLVALPNGKLLGGTTTAAGTGGQRKVDVAELYVLDMASKKIEWHAPLIEGASEYTNMVMTQSGLVYGLVDNARFFVFDPAKRTVIHQENTGERFGGCNYQQGPRKLIVTPDGSVYVLFKNAIGQVNADTFAIEEVAASPVPIQAGGDYHDGRIYFANASHLCSYQLA